MKLRRKYIRLAKTERLYGIEIPIIGLTGGIATGKSTVTARLEERDIPVICADTLVKKIYEKKASLNFIREHFPDVVSGTLIDFKKLREVFFNSTKAKETVETFIYRQLEDEFKVALALFDQPNFIVYDVPLLFEHGIDKKVDISICVYCPQEDQVKRIIKRDKAAEGMATKIIMNQMSIEDKKDKSDFVMNNTSEVTDIKKAVYELINTLCEGK